MDIRPVYLVVAMMMMVITAKAQSNGQLSWLSPSDPNIFQDERGIDEGIVTGPDSIHEEDQMLFASQRFYRDRK